MATEISTATDFLDMYDKLVLFLTGLTTPVWSGTGEGDIFNMKITNSAVTETWTMVFTSASDFSVTGSVSGAQAAGVVGVDYSNTYISFDIQNGPVAFQAGDQVVLSVTTNAFNTSGQQWRLNADRAQTGTPTGLRDRRMSMLEGAGLAGADEIFIGLNAFESQGVPYHNWRIMGFIGFDHTLWADNAFGRNDALSYNDMLLSQPGFDGGGVHAIMDDVTHDYWLVADGRFWVLQYKIGTLYLTCCAGFFLPYGTPEQYPYPLMIGAQEDTLSAELSNTDENFRCFWDSGPDCLRVRLPSGSWQGWQNVYDQSGNEQNSYDANVWPWQGPYSSATRGNFTVQRDNLDGTYTMYPAVLVMDNPNNQTLGEIPYVYAVSGFNNFSENTITEGGDTYICFQNVYRTDRWHFYALKTT